MSDNNGSDQPLTFMQWLLEIRDEHPEATLGFGIALICAAVLSIAAAVLWGIEGVAWVWGIMSIVGVIAGLIIAGASE